MNHVERFRRVMALEPVDRLPVIEWAGWWDLTVKRWRQEGLPKGLESAAEIREHLGLDPYRQLWISPRKSSCPAPAHHGAGLAKDTAGYLDLKKHLYPEPDFDTDEIRDWGERQARGELVAWITLEGFFWYPRTLLGIERHLYAFYDDPDLMHRMNDDLLSYNRRALDAFCRVCTPSYATFAEDLSYNHGPMLSKKCFDEYLAPCYRQIIPDMRARGIIPVIDSDGDVEPLIAWFEEVGIEGILPLERMAGVDVARIRRNHPRFKMIGAYDKTVMHRGEAAMRAEFERLLPVMRKGGFIASCDHQTPPEVSLEQYQDYVALLKEYAHLTAG